MNPTTYVMGRNAMIAYDRTAIKEWMTQTPLMDLQSPHWHWYKSNWRILHIDGFEPGYGSRVLYMFKYDTLPRQVFGESMSSFDAEKLDEV